jgi:hypothetical protein
VEGYEADNVAHGRGLLLLVPRGKPLGVRPKGARAEHPPINQALQVFISHRRARPWVVRSEDIQLLVHGERGRRQRKGVRAFSPASSQCAILGYDQKEK